MTEIARSSLCSVCNLLPAGEDGRCTQHPYSPKDDRSEKCPHCHEEHAAFTPCDQTPTQKLRTLRLEPPADETSAEDDKTLVMDATQLQELRRQSEPPHAKE